MILSSRPEETEDTVGSGPYLMRMEIEELQLLATFLWVTRLGKGPYKEAAFNLMNNIDALMGDDFMQEASEDVNMSISIVDDMDQVQSSHSYHEICIEV